MSETSPASPTQPLSNNQPKDISHPKTKTNYFKVLFLKIRSGAQTFLNALRKREISDDDTIHGLYDLFRHYAEGVKIFIQMGIGVILGIALLIDAIAFLRSIHDNPSKISIAPFNPLDIIAYGLFFSTGIDLAYMLFTPGPDEAIDPVMTGLAAAILLGIGNIGDITKLDMQHAIILTLAVAALAGLFATKKYLFHPQDKNKKDTKKDTVLAKQGGEVQK